jgi:hypothetical protein
VSSDLLRQYVLEVLTGFKALSAVGPDRAQGNLRQGDFTLSPKNKGVLDDLEDAESWEEDEPMRV